MFQQRPGRRTSREAMETKVWGLAGWTLVDLTGIQLKSTHLLGHNWHIVVIPYISIHHMSDISYTPPELPLNNRERMIHYWIYRHPGFAQTYVGWGTLVLKSGIFCTLFSLFHRSSSISLSRNKAVPQFSFIEERGESTTGWNRHVFVQVVQDELMCINDH